MCVVSMIGDWYGDKWRDRPWMPQPIPQPWTQPYQEPVPIQPKVNPDLAELFKSVQGISRKEFEDLKKEVLEMKELLKRAAEYDAKNGEPACEIEDKVALLKKVAEAVGVSLEDIFPSDA